MVLDYSNRTTKSFFLSLALHTILIWLLKPLSFTPSPQSSSLSSKKFKVKTLSKKQLQKYRTVGVKNGAKDFSSPVKVPPSSEQALKRSKDTSKPQVNVYDDKSEKEDNNKLNLKALQAPKDAKDVAAEVDRKKTRTIREAPSTQGEKDVAVRLKNTAQKLDQNTLKNLGVSTANSDVIGLSGVNIQFRPPEGVPKDQLNSAEKIFYAFQKRTFTRYVQSFITTYHNIERQQPYIRSSLKNDKHIMTGKVTFDREGNIISIKFIRWSQDDAVQKLFEETLKNINSLPNPPKGLLKENGELVIYYQLNINA